MKLNSDQITTALGIAGAVVTALQPVVAGGSMTPYGIGMAILVAMFGFFTNRKSQ